MHFQRITTKCLNIALLFRLIDFNKKTEGIRSIKTTINKTCIYKKSTETTYINSDNNFKYKSDNTILKTFSHWIKHWDLGNNYFHFLKILTYLQDKKLLILHVNFRNNPDKHNKGGYNRSNRNTHNQRGYNRGSHDRSNHRQYNNRSRYKLNKRGHNDSTGNKHN